jgi:hypothetical protein
MFSFAASQALSFAICRFPFDIVALAHVYAMIDA